MNALTPITAQPRIWSDIGTIPEERRDGRDVLLWAGFLAVGSWLGSSWVDAVGNDLPGVTAWADVEGPNHG